MTVISFTSKLAVDTYRRPCEHVGCDVFLKHQLLAPNFWRWITLVKRCITVEYLNIVAQMEDDMDIQK